MKELMENFKIIDFEIDVKFEAIVKIVDAKIRN